MELIKEPVTSPLVTKTLERLGRPPWLEAWRELAEITLGITRQDVRFQSTMNALDQCDAAFLANDWPSFQRAAERVRGAVKGESQ